MNEFKYPLRKLKLPSVELIIPYLKLIDQSQWYTNFGPLSFKFEERLAEYFGGSFNEVQLVNNATMGLYLALKALGLKGGEYCAVPSLTFPATIEAVLLSGLKPLFVDVDYETLTVSTEKLRETIKSIDKWEVSSVIPVSFFGYPVDPVKWEEMESELGIKCVIDAAWSFDNLVISNIPSILSFHATKPFGIGEGGLIVTKNSELLESIRISSNFGIDPSRNIKIPGVNAKLSEYGAAIGLAALDQWQAKRTQIFRLTDYYKEGLGSIDGIRVIPGVENEWVSGTVCVIFDKAIRKATMKALQEASIDARYWWIKPCHLMEAFADIERTGLENSENLSDKIINLPFFDEMQKRDIDYIIDMLKQSLSH